MANNISKELVHKCTPNVIKSVFDPKLVSFKHVELGGYSDTRFSSTSLPGSVVAMSTTSRKVATPPKIKSQW